MQKHPEHRRFDEFTILEVFLGVCLFGLIAGAVFIRLFPEAGPGPVVVAPTVGEYRVEAREAMLPFLSVATLLSEGEDVSSLSELAAVTQSAMLAIRVPAEEREAHLAAVLLLDQWKRTVKEGVAPALLLQKTADFTDAHPWMIGAVAPEEALAI